MGTVRLLLSLLVVGSHFANFDGIAGGTAIVAFFVISGFLMARTITENYASPGGVGRFYLNRCVRILPPFVVVLALTFLLLWSRDVQPFQITPAGGTYLPDSDMPPSLWQVVQLNIKGFPNFMFAQAYLAPQAWSLVVEAGFYLAAPVLVLLTHRLIPALYALGGLSLWLAIEAGDHEWVRSSVSGLWTFVLGVLAYRHAALMRVGPTGRTIGRAAAIVALGFVAAAGLNRTPLSDRTILFAVPLAVAAWLVLGQWATRTGSSFDRTLGNWAYGVFIGHFLAIFFMLWLSETVYRATGVFGIIGVPDTDSELRLKVNTWLFPLAMGIAIYYGLERPLERLRTALRQAPPPTPVKIAAATGFSGAADFK